MIATLVSGSRSTSAQTSARSRCIAASAALSLPGALITTRRMAGSGRSKRRLANRAYRSTIAVLPESVEDRRSKIEDHVSGPATPTRWCWDSAAASSIFDLGSSIFDLRQHRRPADLAALQAQEDLVGGVEREGFDLGADGDLGRQSEQLLGVLPCGVGHAAQ